MASALLIRETERADETPTVELDPPTGGRWDDVLPILAGQLLVNLLANATKYGPSGGLIEVAVSNRIDSLFVAVADRGPGLGDDPERLFAPFYRGSGGVVGDEPGTGLGLSIVKAIVEAHGGRVGAFNRDGGGACFWFDLPSGG